MKNYILKLPAALSVTIFILSSCAKTSTPSGGPKDSIPPTLIKSLPKKNELNYKKKTVELEFSEYILLNNPKEQLIITPTINKEFKATATKNIVRIEFEKELKDSTTYTINLRESVQDITEKNPAKNLQLAFSTGPYIDSLSISGQIFDALKGTGYKEATVALLPNTDTINIFKHKPTYITKTNDKGDYKIENLKPGAYFIYAFEDKNKNLIVDSKNESYGFKPKPVLLDSNTIDLNIPVLRLDARSLKLTSAKPYNNYFNIRTSKPLRSYNLSDNNKLLITFFGEDKANVRIYKTDSEQDSIKAHFVGTDSIGNKIDTVLYAKFTKKKTQPEKLTSEITSPKINTKTGLLEFSLTFNKPIIKTNFDSLAYKADSTTRLHIDEKDMRWDSINNQLAITKQLDPKLFLKSTDKKNITKPPLVNQLYAGLGAFISIDTDSSKQMQQQPKLIYEEETGNIIVTLETKENNFIVELLTKDFKVVESKKNAKSITFTNLPPDSYQIRVILDKNGNGLWDNGNFFKRETPEEITFYKNEKKSTTITLKANWELGPLLITF